MIYESQFLASARPRTTAASRPDMLLIYPDPTIFSKHTFVGLTPDGIRLGDFLTNDPEHAPAGHRVRLPDLRYRARSRTFVTDHKLPVPDHPASTSSTHRPTRRSRR